MKTTHVHLTDDEDGLGMVAVHFEELKVFVHAKRVEKSKTMVWLDVWMPPTFEKVNRSSSEKAQDGSRLLSVAFRRSWPKLAKKATVQ